MQRLVKDAAKLDKSVNANSLSYANIVKAIHAVQVKMGVYGTTQKEAEKTVTGSLNAMKSAWGNLLTAIGSGENLDQCFENMISTVEIFGDNIIPVIERSLGGMGTVVEKIAPKIAEILPDLAEKLLPPLIKAAVELTKGLIKALPNIIKALVVSIVDIFGEQFPIIKKIGDFFKNNAGTIADSIKKIIPVVIGLVAAFKGFNAIKGIMSLFGGSKSGGGSSGGFMSGLTNTFKGLANTKTSTVLKGVANLAIILGSLGALLWIATKVFKNGIDFKEMAQVVILIGGLGLVGLELGKLAGIVGKIPIPTVLKGLANMAIILVGVGALLFAATKVFKDGVNFKEMVQVIALMGILGTVGAAVSIFAGIVGMIPIPVVLAGLASMALVLGGITGLIVAFGKLSELKGFNDFIEKGGEVMVKIFNTIGKMGGALIGGIGEGISESLPKIGENISKFATSLKPMFTMFEGVDASGIGSFFKALGSFMLQMAGNDILSFFTGGTNFAKLGTELNEFATNSKGFFTTVAQLPENGFTNGTKLFNCLAGIKSLPKEGGVVGWFKGDISYASMADGLAQLASEKVVTFFNTVAGLKQEGFDMATKMFECFAGLKSLPKEGGVVGWFSGEVSYKNIAAGLETLSSEGIKNFFTMVAGLDPKAFENTKLLFESLASIGKLPKEGGFWDKLTGDESTSLSNLASGLSTFAEKTKTFFEQVNNLNLAQLNGLWDSLKKIEEVPTQIQNIVTGSNTALSDGFTKMINTVKVQGAAMVNSLSTTMKQIKKVVASTDLSSAGSQMMNGLIIGMNRKKGAAVSTARSIANAINAEYRKVQDINSPSGEWENYGEYQIQGDINGMKNKLPLLKSTVQKIGEYSLPYGGSYTPDNSVTTNNRSSVSETNHYSPQFNLTISGTSDDRATARKVKRWVAEALDEAFTSLDNKNPKLREV